MGGSGISQRQRNLPRKSSHITLLQPPESVSAVHLQRRKAPDAIAFDVGGSGISQRRRNLPQKSSHIISSQPPKSVSAGHLQLRKAPDAISFDVGGSGQRRSKLHTKLLETLWQKRLEYLIHGFKSVERSVSWYGQRLSRNSRTQGVLLARDWFEVIRYNLCMLQC